jgi:hypothetical protein
MQEHSVIRLLGLGDNVATWEHLWIAYTSAKNVNFGMGFTGSDIGGFAEQPSDFILDGFSWVFFILLQNTFLRRSWKPRTMGI